MAEGNRVRFEWMLDKMSVDELKRLIESVKRNLAQGRYQNESTIREAVVLPILQRLGWDTIDPAVVRREHPIGSRKVDYCLFVHHTTPDVLVEVKAVGSIEGGDRQLFEYAFHEGVPMAMLTDGREWSFYLPAGHGSYDDRRVYKLDLLERATDECWSALTRYLAFERVKRKEAIADARADYETAARRRTAADALPAAWAKLVEEPDGLMIDLVLEKTQALCGYAPTREQVETFLAALTPPASAFMHPSTIRTRPRQEAPPVVLPPTVREVSLRPSQPKAVDDRSRSGRGVQVVLDGQSRDAKDAITGLTRIIKHLASKDATFLERLEVRTRGRSRNHIARSRAAVYPQRPDLADKAIEILPGWFLDTNISNREKLQIVAQACEVAGLRLGRDIALVAESSG
jgi:predicted type IV restriction endonuclease